ncbi:MAG TPA: general secretion pathway protein GspK [Desulfocapsa sulfexigens]|nr:general secretion pathway protein GspK [Desulfocapsa sulfexigens]
MALLLVISLLSVLLIMTLQFNREMREGYIISGSLGNSIRLSEMARSGITIGEQILLADLDENNFDSLHDSWALLGEEELSDLFNLGDTTVEIQDEGGKYQINAITVQEIDNLPQGTNLAAEKKKREQHAKDVRNVLWRLLRADPFLVEDGDAREIIDALIDWTDSGDGEEEYGAEESYYRSLDPPYSCKNGPIESIEELLMVKGFTPELLYGTEETPGLAPLLTPWGSDGKININSADVLLLQALEWDMDRETAEGMIDYREDENNIEELKDFKWYKEVPSFPGDVELHKDRTTTSSRFFTIKATATIEKQKKRVTATVERTEDKMIKILRWESN